MNASSWRKLWIPVNAAEPLRVRKGPRHCRDFVSPEYQLRGALGLGAWATPVGLTGDWPKLGARWKSRGQSMSRFSPFERLSHDRFLDTSVSEPDRACRSLQPIPAPLGCGCHRTTKR